AVLPADIEVVETHGYYAPGDPGAATYVRVPREPAHAGKLQTPDGAWWELRVEAATVEMFGARGDLTFVLTDVPERPGGGREGFIRTGGSDDQAAFVAADSYALASGLGQFSAEGSYYLA